MSRTREEIELEKAKMILNHFRKKAERSQRLASTGSCPLEQAEEDMLNYRLQELEVEALKIDLGIDQGEQNG